MKLVFNKLLNQDGKKKNIRYIHIQNKRGPNKDPNCNSDREKAQEAMM